MWPFSGPTIELGNPTVVLHKFRPLAAGWGRSCSPPRPVYPSEATGPQTGSCGLVWIGINVNWLAARGSCHASAQCASSRSSAVTTTRIASTAICGNFNAAGDRVRPPAPKDNTFCGIRPPIGLSWPNQPCRLTNNQSGSTSARVRHNDIQKEQPMNPRLLYLVRHGEATSEEQNPARPLTEPGAKEVEQIAAWFTSTKLPVDEIRHSGKLRAQQTAEIFAQYLGLPGSDCEVAQVHRSGAGL